MRPSFAVRCSVVALLSWLAPAIHAQPELPTLDRPVNDFARIIDADNAAQIDRVIRALDAASGDAIVVATVPDMDGYGSIEEYAVKLFANHGRGIGKKGKDNGVLILVARKERKTRIEVGYELEQWITDGYAGETIREFMLPSFRQNDYGGGLLAATTRIAGRIAQARGVTLQNVPLSRPRPSGDRGAMPLWVVVLIFILILVVSRIGGGPGGRSRYWGGGGWSGWSSGGGPFGGGWSSGGGGGFGGGFGGFGGGSSGGGGASGSW